MKRLSPLLLIALLAILFVVGLIWSIVEIEQCHDNGGSVVAPMTRGEECIMPKTEHEGS